MKANAVDNCDSIWDDGVSTGNSWDDYEGVGAYHIEGHSESVDRYPRPLTDRFAPLIRSPPDIEYSVGSVGNSIQWTVFDRSLDSYEVTKNGSIYREGYFMENAQVVAVNVDGLSVGEYQFCIIARDKRGNMAVEGVYVHVNSSASIWIDHPQDIVYELGSTGHSIIWNPTSEHPQWFWLYQDDMVIESRLWNGSSVAVIVDGLTLGVYEFRATVSDTLWNNVSDSVLVRVIASTTPTNGNEEFSLWIRFVGQVVTTGSVFVITVFGILIIRARHKGS
jgi:hypothetical protein